MLLKSQILHLLLSFLVLSSCGGGNEKLAEADGLREKENYPQALALYSKLLDEDPAMKEALSGRGICRLFSQEAEGAMEDLTQAIQLSADPKYADRADYNDFRGIDYYYRGLLYSAMGNGNAAVQDLELAVKYQYNLEETYTQFGIALGSINQHIEAVDNLSKALEINPRYLSALSNRAYQLSILGDNRRSVADYNTVLEIDPSDASSWLNRGYTFLGLDEGEKALSDIEKALEIEPDNMGALTYRGIALQHLGRNEDALQAFSNGIDLFPQYQKLWYGRGVVKVSLGDISGACGDLEVAKSFGDIEGEELRLQYCK